MGEETDETDGVETVENDREPVQEPEETWRFRILGKANSGVKSRNLENVQNTTNKPRVEQRILGQSRSDQLCEAVQSSSYLTEPPDADPHVRWCGRGGALQHPPIPI